MSDLRTAAKQMLDALEGGADSWQLVGPAIDALKEALAAEPVLKPEPQEIADLRQACKEGWRYADELDQERKRLQEKLRAALAEQQAEPVAWLYRGNLHPFDPSHRASDPATPLYAHPPQRPAEPAGVVTSMVKGGVTWHVWPDQMPDGTTLYAAAPIIKPEIKEDNSVPQAQQFFYNAWAR